METERSPVKKQRDCLRYSESFATEWIRMEMGSLGKMNSKGLRSASRNAGKNAGKCKKTKGLKEESF
jgi:hypothetical protein